MAWILFDSGTGVSKRKGWAFQFLDNFVKGFLSSRKYVIIVKPRLKPSQMCVSKAKQQCLIRLWWLEISIQARDKMKYSKPDFCKSPYELTNRRQSWLGQSPWKNNHTTKRNPQLIFFTIAFRIPRSTITRWKENAYLVFVYWAIPPL